MECSERKRGKNTVISDLEEETKGFHDPTKFWAVVRERRSDESESWSRERVIKAEWVLWERWWQKDWTNCECGVRIKERCVIKNIKTAREMIIGNVCVDNLYSEVFCGWCELMRPIGEMVIVIGKGQVCLSCVRKKVPQPRCVRNSPPLVSDQRNGCNGMESKIRSIFGEMELLCEFHSASTWLDSYRNCKCGRKTFLSTCQACETGVAMTPLAKNDDHVFTRRFVLRLGECNRREKKLDTLEEFPIFVLSNGEGVMCCKEEISDGKVSMWFRSLNKQMWIEVDEYEDQKEHPHPLHAASAKNDEWSGLECLDSRYGKSELYLSVFMDTDGDDQHHREPMQESIRKENIKGRGMKRRIQEESELTNVSDSDSDPGDYTVNSSDPGSDCDVIPERNGGQNLLEALYHQVDHTEIVVEFGTQRLHLHKCILELRAPTLLQDEGWKQVKDSERFNAWCEAKKWIYLTKLGSPSVQLYCLARDIGLSNLADLCLTELKKMMSITELLKKMKNIGQVPKEILRCLTDAERCELFLTYSWEEQIDFLSK